MVRKGKRKQLELNSVVYDYQSIHLLTAKMHSQGRKRQTIDFYYKGSLHISEITFAGQTEIEINGENKQANLFEQTRANSETRMRYFYAVDQPALPLRIEKIEADGDQSVMALKQIN